MILPLPSSLRKLPDIWGPLIVREELLRVSQANEALQDLRTEIAKKSAMYRSNDELAAGKRDRLRSYTAINHVEKDMRRLVKRYSEATWALQALGVSGKYPHLRPIRRSDLKAVTSVYKPNAPGQRNSGLSWIWTIANGANTDQRDYLSERTSPFASRVLPGLICAFLPVYRVNWIRGKSRLDRWDEEVTMLTSEMDWFVRYVQHRSATSLAWVGSYDSPGHTAYCHRQADMWDRMALRARAAFLAIGIRCGE